MNSKSEILAADAVMELELWKEIESLLAKYNKVMFGVTEYRLMTRDGKLWFLIERDGKEGCDQTGYLVTDDESGVLLSEMCNKLRLLVESKSTIESERAACKAAEKELAAVQKLLNVVSAENLSLENQLRAIRGR